MSNHCIISFRKGAVCLSELSICYKWNSTDQSDSPPAKHRAWMLGHNGCRTTLGSPAQCPWHHSDLALHWNVKRQTHEHKQQLDETVLIYSSWAWAGAQINSYILLRTLSWHSSAGGSQACSLTFHSLICWSHERRLYFLNLLGVFGWTPGWRICLGERRKIILKINRVVHV